MPYKKRHDILLKHRTGDGLAIEIPIRKGRTLRLLDLTCANRDEQMSKGEHQAVDRYQKENAKIWMFPNIGVPPNHPFVHRVFHYFHHPFWG